MSTEPMNPPLGNELRQRSAAYFLSANCNKPGIALDLKDLDCRQMLWGLAATADVQALAARSAQGWAKLLSEAGVPVGPINSVVEALAHPQVLARGMVTEIGHPTAGTVRTVGSPIKLSGSPQVRTPPPGHGEHTDDVLTALGAGPELLADLRSRGALR
jgi:crotonobetainyl-CoA:carnitine CoA-transferase CaiB-like acyl-CoA transferase